MGFFDGLINSALAPIGVKPFKGGPYPDAGLGDVAQSSMKKAEPLYGQMGNVGSNLLGASTGFGYGSDPVQGMNDATNQYRDNANNGPGPMQGVMQDFGKYMQAYGQSAGVGDVASGNAGDPYGLLPHQQEQLNQGTDLINGQRTTAESALKQHLAGMGMTANDPRMTAALTRLHENFDNDINTHRTNFMETARQNKQKALGDLTGMLQQGGQFQQNQFAQNQGQVANLGDMFRAQIGQGMQGLGQAAAGYSGQAGQYNQLGQEATARTNQAHHDLGAAIGAATGFAGGGAKGPSPFDWRSGAPWTGGSGFTLGMAG